MKSPCPVPGHFWFSWLEFGQLNGGKVVMYRTMVEEPNLFGGSDHVIDWESVTDLSLKPDCKHISCMTLGSYSCILEEPQFSHIQKGYHLYLCGCQGQCFINLKTL